MRAAHRTDGLGKAAGPLPLGRNRTTAGLFVRYVAFAVAATVANLITQEIVFQLAPVAPLATSILMGTIVGFAVKYILDKKWVFDDSYDGGRQELRKLALYGTFSVATTLVFWACEVAFWMIWQSELAKYTGAVLGLSIGYVAKFMLDRKFVFKERSS